MSQLSTQEWSPHDPVSPLDDFFLVASVAIPVVAAVLVLTSDWLGLLDGELTPTPSSTTECECVCEPAPAPDLTTEPQTGTET